MKITRRKLTRPPTLTSEQRRARWRMRSTSPPREQITSRSWKALGLAREIKSLSRQRLNSNAALEPRTGAPERSSQELPRAFSRTTTHRTRSTAARSRADSQSSASRTFTSGQKLETRSGHKTPNIQSQARDNSLKLCQNYRSNEKPSQ